MANQLPWPFVGRIRSLSFWKPVLRRFNEKLSSWKRDYLSLGGRITLQKLPSLISPYLIYQFSKYPCLQSKCNVFKGISCGQKARRWCIVRWNSVTRSIFNGGLGVDCIRERALPLLGNWMWRFPLTGSIMGQNNQKHSWSKSDGWDTKVARQNVLKEFMKCMFDGLSFISTTPRIEAGNCTKTFWEDKWVSEMVLKDKFPMNSGYPQRTGGQLNLQADWATIWHGTCT